MGDNFQNLISALKEKYNVFSIFSVFIFVIGGPMGGLMTTVTTAGFAGIEKVGTNPKTNFLIL